MADVIVIGPGRRERNRVLLVYTRLDSLAWVFVLLVVGRI
jgi:hypothetical protein